MYNRSFTIEGVKIGVKFKTKTRMTFLVSKIESKLMTYAFNKIDHKTTISCSSIDSIRSMFYTLWFE